jgi:hypothetical protein
MKIKFVLLPLCLGAIAAQAQTNPTSRDPWKWPFSWDSIWNVPIGASADLSKSAGFSDASKNGYANFDDPNINNYGAGTGGVWVGFDPESLYKSSNSDPKTNVYLYYEWPRRAYLSPNGYNAYGAWQHYNYPIRFPSNITVPDAAGGSTPNNCTAILTPDAKGIIQSYAFARLSQGSDIFCELWPTKQVWSIYSNGIEGGHYGSGLSTLGGSIRKGEISDSNTDEWAIRHAVKIELWAKRFYSYNTTLVQPGYSYATPGYRWPGTKADAYANADTYRGVIPELCEGTLLALPANVSISSLGIQTLAGKKLFHAMQDYGAYICDDTAWDAVQFGAEAGVESLVSGWGYRNAGAFRSDVIKMVSNLRIVKNNSPSAIGGGGAWRRAGAPGFTAGTVANLVVNGGFEYDQGRTSDAWNWGKWSPNNSYNGASYVEPAVAPSTQGTYCSTHYSGTGGYSVWTSTSVYGLTKSSDSQRLYKLTARCRRGGSADSCLMQVKTLNNSTILASTSIPLNSAWTTVTIDNIEITQGACVVGFWTGNGSANSWVNFDDVQLIRK